jgi:hypothetical protein
MSGFLNLHLLAAARGDGLHPRLRDLLEARARTAADPRIADLSAEAGRPVQAGPNPALERPPFLPGNVVPMDAYRHERSDRREKTVSK